MKVPVNHSFVSFFKCQVFFIIILKAVKTFNCFLEVILYCIFTKQLLCQWMGIAESERGWGWDGAGYCQKNISMSKIYRCICVITAFWINARF